MINASQIRMARAALRWRAIDLAEKAGVGLATINRIEGGGGSNSATLAAIQRALEGAGVTFVEYGVVMAPTELSIRQHLDGVSLKTLETLIHEFDCWLWNYSKRAVTAGEVLRGMDPNGQLASAIAQTLVEMGDTSGPTSKKLAGIFDALQNVSVDIAGRPCRIMSDDNHGNDLLIAIWKVVRGPR